MTDRRATDVDPMVPGVGSPEARVELEIARSTSEVDSYFEQPQGTLTDPADDLPPSTDTPLSEKVRTGAMWSAGSVLLLRFANIAIMAVVARVVVPEQFGVFALALTAHGMVVSLAELGVASAVARSDLDADDIAPTVATISIVTSFSLAAGMALFAQPLADALGSSDAAGPLRVLALSVAMIGPFAVPGAQLQREFRQDRIFLANVVSFVPSSAVLLGLALVGDGAMAFAWSRVAGQLVMGAIMVTGVSRHYWPGFRRSELRPLLAFGLPLALASLLSQILLNVDYVFVGRLMDTEDVGLYMLAFNIAGWSIAVMGSMLNSVVLPAFSRVRRDGGSLPDALGRATGTVALVAFPIGALTLALARPLILTVYGEKWSEAAPVLSVLALYGVMSVLCLLYANVIIAMGRTGVLLGVQVAALIFLVPAMAAGIHFSGLVGVGYAHIAIIFLVTLPAYLIAVRRSTTAGPLVALRAVLRPGVAAAVAAAAAWALSQLLGAPLLQLLLGGIVGALLYGLAMAPQLHELLPRRLAELAPVRLVVGASSRVDGQLARLTHPGRSGGTPQGPTGGQEPPS